MFVEPTGTINLYMDMPFDKDYEHTVWFDSVTAQRGYFTNYAKTKSYTLQDYSYVRINRGKIKVQLPVEKLYGVNYMAFKNNRFGTPELYDKWFYAFVTGVEYINNETTEVAFEIDVIQTYLFDIEFGQCFVERQHMPTDVAGEHTVPEGLELGEYVYKNTEYNTNEDYIYVIIAPYLYKGSGVTLEEKKSGIWIGGVFLGVYMQPFPNTPQGVTMLRDALYEYSRQGIDTEISGIFCMPSNASFIDTHAGYYTFNEQYADLGKTYSLQLFPNNYTTPIKNNKLFTYPYQFIYANNLQGTHREYKYEFFDKTKEYAKFNYSATFSPSGNVMLVPLDYKGVSENYDENLTMGSYPAISYTVDNYQSWMAKSLPSRVGSIISTVGLATAGLMSSNPPTGLALGVGAFKTALGIAVQTTEHQVAPLSSMGNSGSVDLIRKDKFCIQLYHMHIKDEMARIIDDFFSKFGYADRTIHVPNRNARPHWNYVKTVDANVGGNAPAEVLDLFRKIHDKGITYWKNAYEFGNYSLDNSPI